MLKSQKELLDEVARESKVPLTELVREAVHYLLKKEGKDDGLMFDRQEMYEGYLRGIVEMAQKAAERRGEREVSEEAKQYALRIEKGRKEAKAREAAKREADE